jgi:hypothetical protein
MEGDVYEKSISRLSAPLGFGAQSRVMKFTYFQDLHAAPHFAWRLR